MEIVEDAAGITLREVIPRIIDVPAPAAGAEWTVSVTSGAMWFVESIDTKFVTSAVVATRATVLLLGDGTTRFSGVSAGTTVVASSTLRTTWLRGYADHVGVSPGQVASCAFPSIPLFSGWTIASQTFALDAGDQWSAIRLYVLEVEERSFGVELGMDVATLRQQYSNAFPQIPLGS